MSTQTEMVRVLNSELSGQTNNNVLVKGWLHNFRLLGKIAFLIIKDRSGFVQVVVSDPETISLLKDAQVGTVLEVTGKVSATDKTDGGVEIVDPTVEIINKVTEAWPIEINKPELKANLETRLEYRAISLRHEQQAAIFKVQAETAQAYRDYMVEHGYTEYFGPAILASASEGGSELFHVNYFGKPAILAQSNQLYKQMMVGVFERVFAMSKCFRAENSNTRRHLTEVTQFEFEMGFINSSHDVMDELENVTKYMVKRVFEKRAKEMKLLGARKIEIPEGHYPRLTFTEATKVVSEITGEDVSDWQDLTTDSERVLCEWAREKHGSDFVFVMNYPKGKFYAYKDENGMYHNFDLLFREAEIVSGGRRIDNYDQLVAAIKAEGLDPADFSEYLSIFKYGMPPHGGFGMGFERFTTFIIGLDNVREGTLFPSDTKRIASQSVPDPVVKGVDPIKKAIKELFVNNDLEFHILKHVPTPTSKDAAEVRGLDLSTGVKAMILRDKANGENYLVAIPAQLRLDMKKVAAGLSTPEKSVKLEFEKPEVILERYGLVVGGVPPFGQSFGVQTLIDQKIFDTEVAAFNIAEQTESLICKSKDLKVVLQGKVGEWTE